MNTIETKTGRVKSAKSFSICADETADQSSCR